MIAYTMAFVTPVVKHWLEWENEVNVHHHKDYENYQIFDKV